MDKVGFLMKAPDLSIIPPKFTLRDQFAAIALAGQMNVEVDAVRQAKFVARDSYIIADAMMKEREATKERWKDERPED